MLQKATVVSCVFAVVTTMCVACGDTTSATGELGRLSYSLNTDYELGQQRLTDVRIVTEHPQILQVELTHNGARQVTSPERISHRSKSSDVEVETLDSGSADRSPSLKITAHRAGIALIESRYDGKLLDRIRLNFAKPVSFELLLQVRAPYTDEFVPQNETHTLSCEEGSQITVDAVPLDSVGLRLAGVMKTEAIISPPWMAVPGVGVLESYENGSWKLTGQANFYFIEPGVATLTVTDEITDTSSSREVSVSPVVKGGI